MANVIASQTLAGGASVTSSSTSWTNNDIIVCSCLNGPVPPSLPCYATLFGSIDNTNFVQLDSRQFGKEPGQIYYTSFRLSDYLGVSLSPDALQRLNSQTAALWSNLKITIGGNDNQTVTVAAVH